jgi:hypothetical protein
LKREAGAELQIELLKAMQATTAVYLEEKEP